MLFLVFGTDVYIESFLKEWKNDYKRLERVHSYIQWYVCLSLWCTFWLCAVWGYKTNVILYWWSCSWVHVACSSARHVLLQKEHCKLSFFWSAKGARRLKWKAKQARHKQKKPTQNTSLLTASYIHCLSTKHKLFVPNEKMNKKNPILMRLPLIW